MSTKTKQEKDRANDGPNVESPDTSSQQQDDGGDGSSSGGGGSNGQDSSTTQGSSTSSISSSSPPNAPSPPVKEEGEVSGGSTVSSSASASRGATAPNSKSASPQNLPQFHYSRDELLELKHAPLSLAWPSCLDPAFRKVPGRWDPEKWYRAVHDGARPSTQAPSAPQAPASSANTRPDRPPDLELKRSRDPRERIKQEEQEGVVLSPQRRSFSTGCHGLQQGPSSSNRPDSPAERPHPQRETHREIPTRRIGSGRISRRDDLEAPGPDRRDLGRRDRDLDRDLDQRRDSRDWRSKPDQRFDRDDRFDNRRRFFEDDDMDKRGDRRDRRGNQDRRKMNRPEEEEAPEWFTGGPTSQNEYIELVGFDDIPEENNQNNKPQSKRERRRSKKDKEGGGSRKGSRSSTPIVVEDAGKPNKDAHPEPHPHAHMHPTVIEPTAEDDARGFNIDDFLGDIIGLPSAGLPEELAVNPADMMGSSKLKQFFKRDSPVLCSTSNSRRSSIEIPPHLNTLLSEITGSEPNIVIPSPTAGLDSNRFFAPISPADKTAGNSIVDLLHQARGAMTGPELGPPLPVMPPGLQGPQQPPSIKDLMMDGKGQSLEEVEAGIRNMQGPSHGQMGHHGPKQMTAFNDFLSQISSSQGPGRGEPRNQAPDNVLIKLLNGGMKDGDKPPNMPHQPPMPKSENDIFAMLLGQQGNQGPGMQQPQQPPRNMPPMSVPNLSIPPPTIAQPRMPARSQPPPNMGPMAGHNQSQDVLMKLFQAQAQHQQQQQQQQQQMSQMKKDQPHPMDVKRQEIMQYMRQQEAMQKQQMSQQQQQQQQMSQQQKMQQQLQPVDPIKHFIDMYPMIASPQPQDQVVRDAITRPDVQALLQKIASGRLTASQLMKHAASSTVSPSQRDAINTVLQFLKGSNQSVMPQRTTLTPSPTPQAVVGGGLSLGTGASLSPRVASPNPDSNMLNPHMMQQSRVSPLMFTGAGMGGAPPRRSITRQELVAYTQSIMQKALLKQELEKAKEDGSPSKSGAKSQSPLAFTPTSVMRKMTAERDRHHDRSDKPDSPGMVGDMLNGTDKSRDQLEKRNVAMQMQNQMQQQGRGKVDNKDMRRGPSPLPPGRSMMAGNGPMMMGGSNMGMMNMNPHNLGPPGQRHPSNLQPSNPLQPPTNSLQTPGNTLQPPNMAMQADNTHLVRALQNYRRQALLKQQLGMGHPRADGGLQVPMMNLGGSSHRSSPDNNLAQFFNRDIMAQVQAGGLPDLPGGKVLSLEEVERLQQTQAVPN